MPVHDVQVKQVGLRLVSAPCFLRELSKISGEEGGRDDHAREAAAQNSKFKVQSSREAWGERARQAELL